MVAVLVPWLEQGLRVLLAVPADLLIAWEVLQWDLELGLGWLVVLIIVSLVGRSALAQMRVAAVSVLELRWLEPMLEKQLTMELL